MMACEDYTSIWEPIAQMAVKDAAFCPYHDTMGAIAFATIVMFGVIFVPMTIRQDSYITPLVVAIIIGGVIMTSMAAMGQGIVTLALLVGLPIALLLLIRWWL